ncbi:Hpt domain-containing protein [Parvibaculum sp.]|jgi:chemotaxis protein histidine kinase CheA|uniref:Hpt domain-containing protein n=1 Tax=Parvibaculum sp. TaxID=2024848 RepID=UPI001B274B5E|nr:Hpt domain-containing protein [Parvibaculum sp.]MBO6633400.1 Hpt domain-containing protein [Parvibaculum sp.]MBO6679337.1 Hpt domain-containing protein [Parvibaculum sp.]MBO6685990.1 Hpt domain-containing protein [Parvibaculum sp.]MBO6904540.1 Hpt domain-containing protein [Parvibaculum sp.]
MAIPKDDKSPDFASLIAQAEAAVEALRDTYRVQLSSDVAELCDIWSRIETEGASSELLDALHGVAHNIKGQGGSFGYELVTDIGASFCDYLRGGKRVSPDELNIVHMHIRMLKRVSDDDLSGDGGETGARIVEKLRLLTGA